MRMIFGSPSDRMPQPLGRSPAAPPKVCQYEYTDCRRQVAITPATVDFFYHFCHRLVSLLSDLLERVPERPLDINAGFTPIY